MPIPLLLSLLVLILQWHLPPSPNCAQKSQLLVVAR